MTLVDKLLTVYWPQTTLIILGIGFLIKRILDNKYRKIEINYSIFQQKKLESLQKFITAYFNYQQMWRCINLDEIASKSISAEDLDNIIEPAYKDLKNSIFELQIYFHNDDYSLFEKILYNTKAYYSSVQGLLFNYEADKSSFDKLIEFRQNSKAYLTENNMLIKQVNGIVKKSF